ncbi:S-adenosyl-L-methionine-dependent methyltransferase [Calycina marina]|uniref:S-adenosyl-L-methionine-dependent methyltransferase n=1 Tax=Calycina marina TaxID=1763456 RepID=A0A9P7YX83_9HELO|nr:S-adenosyl-L-methionine-dependent methyltransferase [Calycina marina]
MLPRTGLAPLLASLDIPGEIELPNGSICSIGSGPPSYRIVFRSEKALRTPMTELSIGEAFIKGEIDVQGDIGVLFGARECVQDKMPLRQKIQFVYDFIRTSTKMNAKAVGEHYSRGDDFYLTFIDKRYRFYSQGLFQKPDETIEEASEHKLETMFKGLDLKPGMRLLDIGGGWGGVTQYCGARGIHVTTLTIAEDSHKFITRLLGEQKLPGEVFLEDFLNHKPAEPYDHAVIYGVIEHIPNYRRFARSVWKILKPGGRLYLDGSAAIEKFAVSAWTRDYVWRGSHTFMTVQDVIAEMLYHGFEILEVSRETSDYELTMLEWAKRLDAAKESIVAGWGEQTYRVFRLFLWGGTHAFKTNSLQAYHLIAERTSSPGPRPSFVRRITQFIGTFR